MKATELFSQNEDSNIAPAIVDQYLEAVKNRDRRFFSSFVYVVKTTGVFCRPSCPSRKPSLDRVEFFSNSEQAREAGFRACLRCRPDAPLEKPEQLAWIEKVCKYMDENFSDKIRLDSLAKIADQSPFYFHRTFKQYMGVTPRQYLEAVRLKHLKLSLKRGESARKSTYAAGYNTTGWLYSSGDSKIGVSPAEYRSGGKGLTIAYSLTECTLGRLLVAATTNGVCFVALGDSDPRLLSHLKSEYPHAQIISDAEAGIDMGGWISEILEYLQGKNRLLSSNLPIDVQATAFQWKVWKELQNIPYGATRSYNEIAERIGVPKGYRAVANACASNHVPLAIPCHRVVRKNGDLGGYRWGVERKRKLLEMEQRTSE